MHGKTMNVDDGTTTLTKSIRQPNDYAVIAYKYVHFNGDKNKYICHFDFNVYAYNAYLNVMQFGI